MDKANVTVLPEVTNCDKTILAAGSVVTKDVQENTITAGVPAQIAREAELCQVN